MQMPVPVDVVNMARTTSRKTESTIDAAVSKLRKRAWEVEPGMLLGGEEALIAQLGVSRATIRQAARLLEREGLLRVRRGINGGYFSARPDLHTIEAAVSAYLEMVDTDAEEPLAIASALWVEVMRRMARLETGKAATLVEDFRKVLSQVSPNASFDDVLDFEQGFRKAIFDLLNARYIELIFQVNMVFQRRHFPTFPSDRDNTAEHLEFVHAWRNAKLMEFDAIAEGNPALAMMAARRTRDLWHRRLGFPSFF